MTAKRHPRGYWTKERCIEESQKYETRAAFCKTRPAICTLMYRNNWMDNPDTPPAGGKGRPSTHGVKGLDFSCIRYFWAGVAPTQRSG